MARAKIVRAILVLILSAPEQRQSSARTGPGADRRVYERSSTGPGLKFLARSKVTQFRSGRWSQCRPIWRCSVTMTVIPYLAEFMNGPGKSSAALLLVCEHKFYRLVQTILVRTKSGWVTEKGISVLLLSSYVPESTMHWGWWHCLMKSAEMGVQTEFIFNILYIRHVHSQLHKLFTSDMSFILISIALINVTDHEGIIGIDEFR